MEKLAVKLKSKIKSPSCTSRILNERLKSGKTLQINGRVKGSFGLIIIEHSVALIFHMLV